MRCVNQTHKDFLDLAEKLDKSTVTLAGIVSEWMDRMDTNNIPSMQDIGAFYNLKNNKELYNKYKLINTKGELKHLSLERARNWAKTNNENAPYHFEVTKISDGNQYTLLIQDKGSNLNKIQSNTISHIIDEKNLATQEDVENFFNEQPESPKIKNPFEDNTFINEEGDIVLRYKQENNTNVSELIELNKIVKAVNEVKKLIPNIPIEIVKDYIKVIYNQDARAVGKFEKGLITLSAKAKDIDKTAKHEAFHAVFAALRTINPKLYEQILNEGSKKYGIKRGKSKINVKYSVEQQNQINYSLKAISNIQDNITKVVKWYGTKGLDFWSKLQNDLQIPKQQIELLKQTYENLLNKARIGIPSNQEFIEEMLADFAANYSYTIEINTSKEQMSDIKLQELSRNKEFRFGNFKYFSDNEGYWKFDNTEESLNNRELTRISLSDYTKAYRSSIETSPTQHYSNLTVPGGTAYTENEISTPLITPSIKGHAQFSTDNGIGWFRSDDKNPFTGFLEDLVTSGTIKKVPC